MNVICDSSSLILLEKAGILGVLAEKCKLTISNQVYQETVEEGLKRNLVDAVKINELIRNKKIIVKKVNKKMVFPMSLGMGEKESIELFYQEKADKLAVDDKKVFNLCNVLKVPYVTVHSILLDLYKMGLIDKNKALASLEILNLEGRYTSDIILYYYDKIAKGE